MGREASIFIWRCFQDFAQFSCFETLFKIYAHLCDDPGLNLFFWSAVMKIYPFTTFCWVNKDEDIYSSPTNFPSSYANVFLKVTKKNIVWNHCSSGPTSIYLFEFNNINSRIDCKICSKITKEAPDVVVLVSFLLILNIIDMLH